MLPMRSLNDGWHPGVDAVFGLPADGINGLSDALRKSQEQSSQRSLGSNDANVRHHAAILVLADVAVIDKIACLGERNSHHNG